MLVNILTLVNLALFWKRQGLAKSEMAGMYLGRNGTVSYATSWPRTEHWGPEWKIIWTGTVRPGTLQGTPRNGTERFVARQSVAWVPTRQILARIPAWRILARIPARRILAQISARRILARIPAPRILARILPQSSQAGPWPGNFV